MCLRLLLHQLLQDVNVFAVSKLGIGEQLLNSEIPLSLGDACGLIFSAVGRVTGDGAVLDGKLP